MVNDPTTPESVGEAYPGELKALRAIRASIAAHGCLMCQLRASVAARHAETAPPTHQHPALRIVINEEE